MRLSHVTSLALLLIPLTATAADKIYSPGHHPHSGGAQPLPPAENVEGLPGMLDMKVGEKRSFRVSGSAVCGDPDLARVTVSSKVMTVLALKEGKTKIFIFPGTNGKGPPSPDALKSNRDIDFHVSR